MRRNLVHPFYQFSNNQRAFFPFDLFRDFELQEKAQNQNDITYDFSDRHIKENERAFSLSFDLPGIDLKDITIERKDDLLSVSAIRIWRESEEKSYTKKYQEQFRLPENIDVEKIEAHYENGVLNLILPKQLKAEPKALKIAINTGPKTSSWLSYFSLPSSDKKSVN